MVGAAESEIAILPREEILYHIGDIPAYMVANSSDVQDAH